MTLVVHSSQLPVTAGVLFEFHRDVANLGRISPPIPRFELIGEPKPTELGDEQTFRLSLGPVGVRWRALVTRVDPGRLIEDTQLDGPFRSWRHQHRFSNEGEGSRLTDAVSFRLIPTRAGEFAEWLLVRPGIRLMFAWRHWKTRRLLTGSRTR